MPGNSRSLWSALNISKDVGSTEIPSNMYHNDIRIPDAEVANCFANFFEEKVDKIVKSAIIDPTVYFGRTIYIYFFFSTCGPNWTQVRSHIIGYIPVPIGLYLL